MAIVCREGGLALSSRIAIQGVLGGAVVGFVMGVIGGCSLSDGRLAHISVCEIKLYSLGPKALRILEGETKGNAQQSHEGCFSIDGGTK